MQCAQAYLNVHWSFILSFRQVNLWFKEPYVFYSCTTESDELSSSECCWKENLQLKVAALTQQPKKMVCTLSKTICWNIKKGLITKISFKIFQNLKFEGHKKNRVLLALWLELCSKFSWFSHGRWWDVKLTVG